MSISDEVKVGMSVERTGVTVLDLLRIEDPILGAPILLASNPEDVEHQAEIYKASLFTIARGAEGGAPSTCTINILDIDQSILLALESLPPSQEDNEKTTIRFLMIDVEAPGIRQIEEEYELESYEVGDDCLLILTVLSDPYMAVEIPSHSFTPDLFPSIHPTIEGE